MPQLAGPLQNIATLETVTDDQKVQLAKTLWGWTPCENCLGLRCVTRTCPSRRMARLDTFFKYYGKMTASYVPSLLPGTRPAIQSHNDITEIIKLLKDNPDKTRSQLINDHFSSPNQQTQNAPTDQDKNRAFDLAVRILVMVNSSSDLKATNRLEAGEDSAVWSEDETFTKFMETSFPKSTAIAHNNPQNNPQRGQNNNATPRLANIKALIRAKRLKRIANLKLEPTDDIKNHLHLNHENGTVEIYHHFSVLKEDLMLTKAAANLTMSESIKQ